MVSQVAVASMKAAVRPAPSGSNDQASKAMQANSSSARTPPAPISSRVRRSCTRQASLTSVYSIGNSTMNARPMLGTRQPARLAM
ncbi:hypothetical protein D9M71_605830 [compost metagenome]